MSFLIKSICKTSCYMCQSVVFVIFRDLTNIYWYNELIELEKQNELSLIIEENEGLEISENRLQEEIILGSSSTDTVECEIETVQSDDREEKIYLGDHIEIVDVIRFDDDQQMGNIMLVDHRQMRENHLFDDQQLGNVLEEQLLNQEDHQQLEFDKQQMENALGNHTQIENLLFDEQMENDLGDHRQMNDFGDHRQIEDLSFDNQKTEHVLGNHTQIQNRSFDYQLMENVLDDHKQIENVLDDHKQMENVSGDHRQMEDLSFDGQEMDNVLGDQKQMENVSGDHRQMDIIFKSNSSEEEYDCNDQNQHGCQCYKNHTCLQVILEEDDEMTDEMLSKSQLKSVDTGSVSDWLYKVSPAICLLPANDVFDVSPSEIQQMNEQELNINKIDEDEVFKQQYVNQWLEKTENFYSSNLCAGDFDKY